MGNDSLARLSERNEVRVNKVVKVLRLILVLSICLSFLAADHLLIQVWRWPGWLVYVAGPMLGAIVWLGLTVGALLALLSLGDASRKATREAGQRGQLHREIP